VRKAGLIVFGILLLALLAVGIDRMSTGSIARRARTLRVGDSKQLVEERLGRPVRVFVPLPDARTNMVAAMLSVNGETWAYGSQLDFRRSFHAGFPYFFPSRLVRFRIFKPADDDVAIEFDSAGKVSEITIPP